MGDMVRIATADPPYLFHESKASATLFGWIWFQIGPFFWAINPFFLKTDANHKPPFILESELTDKAFRRNWLRLIQKIFEADPFIWPKCSGAMLLIAFIKDPDVIKKILKHIDFWVVKRKPRPMANAYQPLESPTHRYVSRIRRAAGSQHG
jgi:hypothetical protein